MLISSIKLNKKIYFEENNSGLTCLSVNDSDPPIRRSRMRWKQAAKMLPSGSRISSLKSRVLRQHQSEPLPCSFRNMSFQLMSTNRKQGKDHTSTILRWIKITTFLNVYNKSERFNRCLGNSKKLAKRSHISATIHFHLILLKAFLKCSE